MKIFKNNEHSLIIKTFGVKDTLHLATTILLYFDLNNPDALLGEQELWKTVPEQLCQGGILDVGMPKPRGEVLATGKCFAPMGKTRTASEVSISVGSLNKKLSVFGERFWKRTLGMPKVITDPKPFAEIPVTWQNAFGGEDFAKNPVGKGFKPIQMPDGSSLIPLPNIEDPNNLIGSPSDRPEPAGFRPLDLMWPQRFKKQGTYDKRWHRERWPHFPEDMNYEFFNTAPEDQFISGFFTGDETIEAVNMHPDFQVIHSHLPPKRIRCFVTKKKDLKAGHDEDTIFEEVRTHIDTVWLFPTILRGVVMYRGTTKVLDDEYADVTRIFLATESMGKDPEPIEHYLEEQTKILDRSVPIDQAVLQKAQQKIGEALKRFKALPKDIYAAKLKAMGKTPTMPRSPAEMKGRSEAIISESTALLTRLEIQAREMHLRYGHMVRIPLEKFDILRDRIRSHEEHIDKAVAELGEAEKKKVEAQKKISKQLKENIKPEDVEKAGVEVDPDNLMVEPSVNPWHDQCFPFAVQCRKNMERDSEAQKNLHQLGFDKKTISRAWLGINPEKQLRHAEDWGIDPQVGGQGNPRQVVVPAGLVIPRFDEAALNRILIRPGNFSKAEEDVLVDGSDETPLFLPAATLINLPGAPAAESAPVVRVGDELQALLVEQEVGDACSVIALKEAREQPGSEAAKAIETATPFLIVLPTGTDCEKERQDWAGSYPNARKLLLPSGTTVFDARKNGTDIRSWIMAALPVEIAGKHQVEPAIPETGKPPSKSPMEGLSIPALDTKSMVEGLIKEIRGFHQPNFDKTEAKKEEVLAKAREAMTKAGKDPNQVMAAAESQPRKSFAETGERLAKNITEERDKLRGAGLLTPEIESKMNASAAQVLQMGRDGEARYQEGMAKLEAGKKKLAGAGEPPDGVKEKLKAVGLDPDKIKKRTREEVIEMHHRGESLAFAILSGVDLSGLDLSGIDLSSAQCRKTKFCDTILDGATLSQTLAQEADFAKASLKKIKSEKGIFSKAIFKEARLNDSDFHMSVLQEADLSKADCSGSKFHMTVLQKAKLNSTNFSRVRANMCIFSSADASDANFAGAHLTKCLFQKTGLDRADFSNAVINSTIFQEAKGEEVKFAGADMSKARMGGKASFPKADFRNIKMAQGCFRDSDLSGALFQGSELEMAMLENCNLQGADFYRVSAKRTRFSKSNLEGTDMRGINLFHGSLRKARLVNTDLRGSNLYGVDFYKAVMGNTRLNDANLKMTQLFNRTEYLP
ncbi:MAG: DUF2169 domain-containing protein [Pseudomonadota bacterium]